MAKPENAKQITMYVPADVLAKVDEAAYQMRQRRNDRTTWILSAIDEKLARDAAIIADADPADQARVKEIVSSYEAVNETGKEWLHITAVIARGADDFKK
jgi:hypothetical protein